MTVDAPEFEWAREIEREINMPTGKHKPVLYRRVDDSTVGVTFERVSRSWLGFRSFERAELYVAFADDGRLFWARTGVSIELCSAHAWASLFFALNRTEDPKRWNPQCLVLSSRKEFFGDLRKEA